MIRTLWRFAASCLAATAALTLAHSDSYPTQPVRLVVPFGAGGVTDIVGRVVARRL